MLRLQLIVVRVVYGNVTRVLRQRRRFLCQNVEMVYTAVALRTLRIADVMSPPRGGGLASDRFAPAPAALQPL